MLVGQAAKQHRHRCQSCGHVIVANSILGDLISTVQPWATRDGDIFGVDRATRKMAFRAVFCLKKQITGVTQVIVTRTYETPIAVALRGRQQ
jgi:hypothetical protein